MINDRMNVEVGSKICNRTKNCDLKQKEENVSIYRSFDSSLQMVIIFLDFTSFAVLRNWGGVLVSAISQHANSVVKIQFGVEREGRSGTPGI